jgi:alpha-D-ribose 1-methylphosphonate 5-triphosphate diphosphatase PhnM
VVKDLNLCFFLLKIVFIVKNSSERRHANEMTTRAMFSAIRQFSQNPSVKLKRIIIVDHQVQIKRMSKRVKKYQKQNQTKSSTNNNNIDLDKDDGQSFTNIFGIPKISEVVSSSSESDDEIEPEEYVLPYIDQAKS